MPRLMASCRLDLRRRVNWAVDSAAGRGHSTLRAAQIAGSVDPTRDDERRETRLLSNGLVDMVMGGWDMRAVAHGRALVLSLVARRRST